MKKTIKPKNPKRPIDKKRKAITDVVNDMNLEQVSMTLRYVDKLRKEQ